MAQLARGGAGQESILPQKLTARLHGGQFFTGDCSSSRAGTQGHSPGTTVYRRLGLAHAGPRVVSGLGPSGPPALLLLYSGIGLPWSDTEGFFFFNPLIFIYLSTVQYSTVQYSSTTVLGTELRALYTLDKCFH